MDSKKEIYEIEFTEDCRDEIIKIYEYISEKLVVKETANRLMRKIKVIVMDLAEFPRLYAKIDKTDKEKREFRKIIVDNYVILYTIDENIKKVYVSHMYYGGRDYLNGGIL